MRLWNGKKFGAWHWYRPSLQMNACDTRLFHDNAVAAIDYRLEEICEIRNRAGTKELGPSRR